jgi:REP-associated tyrosine transposase
MSHARQVFKGATLAVVRRCSEQRFFLIPTRRLNRVLPFLLAHYAERHGIELHGFVFMANHFHLVLTDRRGRLPLFMGDFDALLTRVQNHALGRSGSLWESGSYTSWVLKTQEEVLQHLAYVAANPTAAYQVRRPGSYRGSISLPKDVGTSTTHRPPREGLFGCGHEGSALPESAVLTLTVPPYFSANPTRFRALFERALGEVLTELHARDGSYSGRNAVLSLDPFSAPKSASKAPSFGLIPALTNASQEDRAELKAWRQAVRQAYHLWRAGKDPIFPLGSFLMPRRYGARVAT